LEELESKNLVDDSLLASEMPKHSRHISEITETTPNNTLKVSIVSVPAKPE
jgi:hypothetical protein